MSSPSENHFYNYLQALRRRVFDFTSSCHWRLSPPVFAIRQWYHEQEISIATNSKHSVFSGESSSSDNNPVRVWRFRGKFFNFDFMVKECGCKWLWSHHIRQSVMHRSDAKNTNSSVIYTRHPVSVCIISHSTTSTVILLKYCSPAPRKRFISPIFRCLSDR